MPARLIILVDPADLPTRQWLADLGAWWSSTAQGWLIQLPTDPAAADSLTQGLNARGITWAHDPFGSTP